ncbi:MAG TPA: hypothetical protein VJ874_05220 [Candidatus Thermoplasmatota archaeon]|nr:hypothetical protein [Candidatus Thermoplasmatota archaeon]
MNGGVIVLVAALGLAAAIGGAGELREMAGPAADADGSDDATAADRANRPSDGLDPESLPVRPALDDDRDGKRGDGDRDGKHDDGDRGHHRDDDRRDDDGERDGDDEDGDDSEDDD